MLKIKDNVDLKELEKYGFVKKIERISVLGNVTCYCITQNVHRSNTLHSNERVMMRINEFNRRIVTSCSETVNDILFDLIQAGLVEKVETCTK